MMTMAALSPSSAEVAGPAKLGNGDVGLVDLGHIGKTVGAKIDGDLGCNFPRNYKVALDYPNETLSLFTP
jgi:hypothetical protein